MKYVAVFLIRLYRKWISPIKPPCCRFSPTCSAYALEAFQKRGFWVGLVLSLSRLLRCNPFGRAGYDPVPDKGWKAVPLTSRKGADDTQKGDPVAPRESGGDTTH